MSFPLAAPKFDPQRLLGALKATGSSDPDILYAKKEEMLVEVRSRKVFAWPFIIAGAFLTLTMIGAPVGIPVMAWGFWTKGRIKKHVAEAEAAYGQYLESLKGRLRQVG